MCQLICYMGFIVTATSVTSIHARYHVPPHAALVLSKALIVRFLGSTWGRSGADRGYDSTTDKDVASSAASSCACRALTFAVELMHLMVLAPWFHNSMASEIGMHTRKSPVVIWIWINKERLILYYRPVTQPCEERSDPPPPPRSIT